MPRTLILAIVLLSACDSRPPTNVAQIRRLPAPPPAPETIRVVTLGDSLAYGAGDESGGGISRRLTDELPNVETVNHGVNGAQTSDVLFRLKQDRLRSAIAGADAIVLSIGANDLFRTPSAREEVLRNPIVVASRILERLAGIVAELHRINPDARILILGGYNPVPDHPLAPRIDEYLEMWDAAVTAQFEDDPLVAIVRLSDIVTRARLSRDDHFHPDGDAYRAASKRIAAMLRSGTRS